MRAAIISIAGILAGAGVYFFIWPSLMLALVVGVLVAAAAGEL